MNKIVVQQKYLVEFEITVQIEEILDGDLDLDRQRKLQAILLSDSEVNEALLRSKLKYALYKYVLNVRLNFVKKSKFGIPTDNGGYKQDRNRDRKC